MTTALLAPRSGGRMWTLPAVTVALLGVLTAAAIAAGLGWASVLLVAWGTFAAAAALADVRTGRLPDRLVLPGIALVLVGSALDDRLSGAGAGALLFGVPLLVVHLARPDGMGFGDVKFASMLGAGIGLVAAPLVLPAYLLSALLHVGVCWIVRAGRRLTPFGPSLSLGSIAVVVIALVGRT